MCGLLHVRSRVTALGTAPAGAGYEQCHAKLLRLLERLVYLKDITPDYTYYGIASPWLQVMLGQFVQNGRLPADCIAVSKAWSSRPPLMAGESACKGTLNSQASADLLPSVAGCLHDQQ